MIEDFIVVLNDGQTFGPLKGAAIYKLKDSERDGETVEEMLRTHERAEGGEPDGNVAVMWPASRIAKLLEPPDSFASWKARKDEFANLVSERLRDTALTPAQREALEYMLAALDAAGINAESVARLEDAGRKLDAAIRPPSFFDVLPRAGTPLPSKVLGNGATVLLAKPLPKRDGLCHGSIVLCRFGSELVTWHCNEDTGGCDHGHYYRSDRLQEAFDDWCART